MSYLKNIYLGRYVLSSLVGQDLKNRYRGSIFGIGWSLLQPLGLVIIIGTVFSKVLGQPISEFIPYLFSGLMPWLFFVNSAEGGTGSFIAAEGYIKQTLTPVEVFPLRVSLVAFVNLIYSLIAFFAVYVILSPEKFNLIMLMAIPALLLWLLFGISVATLSAIVNTHIRDYGPLQSLIIQGLFYATPIMFPAELLKERNFDWVYIWNPLYYMMEIIRNTLLGVKIPDLKVWLIAITFTLLLTAISVIAMTSIGRKITFKL